MLRVAMLAALAVGLVTGLALAPAYDASPAGAHAAVAAAPKLVRGAHAWAASLALALAALVAARAFVGGARGRAWAKDAGALVALAGALLVGRILAWDQHAWESLAHVDQLARLVGVRVVDRADATRAPLGLLFALHALLGVGGALAWRGRLAARDAWTAGGVAVGALALAILAPPALGPAPIPALSALQPDWPFLWLAPLERAWGALGLAGGLVLAAAALAAAPLVPPGRRRVALALAAVLVLGLSALALAYP